MRKRIWVIIEILFAVILWLADPTILRPYLAYILFMVATLLTYQLIATGWVTGKIASFVSRMARGWRSAMYVIAAIVGAFLFVAYWHGILKSMEIAPQSGSLEQSTSKPNIDTGWVVEGDWLVLRIENRKESNEFLAKVNISALYEGFQEHLARKEFTLRWEETGTNYIRILKGGSARAKVVRFERSNGLVERFEVWGYKEGSGSEAEQIVPAWWSKVVLPAQILRMEVVISENKEALRTKRLYLRTEGRWLLAQDGEDWSTQIGPYRSDYPAKF